MMMTQFGRKCSELVTICRRELWGRSFGVQDCSYLTLRFSLRDGCGYWNEWILELQEILQRIKTIYVHIFVCLSHSTSNSSVLPSQPRHSASDAWAVISCHFLAFPDISWHHQQCECIIGTVCGLPELSNHISNGLSRSHGFQWHTFLLEVEVAALHCIAERQYLPNTRSSILSLRALLSYIQGVFFIGTPPKSSKYKKLI